MDDQKNTFLVHLDTCQHVVRLPMEQRGLLFSCLYWFAVEMNERGVKADPQELLRQKTGMTPETEMAFTFMAAAMARDFEKWQEKRTNYQAAAKRRQEQKTRMEQAAPYRGRGVDVYPTRAEERALLGDE